MFFRGDWVEKEIVRAQFTAVCYMVAHLHIEGTYWSRISDYGALFRLANGLVE
jgi:hypothetical protein